MAGGMTCPQWCVEHHDPDPRERDEGEEGTHFGPEMSVSVDELRSLVVTVGAYDYRGRRETLVLLDDHPGRGTAQLTGLQAHTVASAVLLATDLYAKTPPEVGVCPPWCTTDHDAPPQDPSRRGQVRHVGAAVIVPAKGPRITGSQVCVRVAALDTAGTARRLFVELAVGTEYVGLDMARACVVAGKLLDADDLYTN
ncbi:DUF6907 domain-containing protein [Nocardia takedensis]|uniref:DUF6907 domain-containing protein n=1 Tax=Nocardia takedensis TaxID=259390 RepID=UPI003F75AF85